MNKSSLKPTLVNSTDMLNGLILIFEQKAKRRSVQLSADLRDPIHFMCFEREIHQVLTNLISNGIEALPAGGRLGIRLGRLTLWPCGKPGIRITVFDNGCGDLPPEISTIASCDSLVMYSGGRKHEEEPVYGRADHRCSEAT